MAGRMGKWRLAHGKVGKGANKVANAHWNLATLLPALRVNRALHLATLATL